MFSDLHILGNFDKNSHLSLKLCNFQGINGIIAAGYIPSLVIVESFNDGVMAGKKDAKCSSIKSEY